MRFRLLLAGTALGCLAPLVGARADVSIEYAVKAAYLPKFVPFITWPNATFASPSAPVTICLLGDDPFDGKLDQAATSVKSGDRGIIVRHLTAAEQSASCHMIFLGSTNQTLAEGTLDAIKDKPVVTVTDSGLKAHGMISFVIQTNHVLFDIDDAAAARSGITISSKLLALAHNVNPRGKP